MKKNIAILGSTGSIGLTTLKIISENKSSFQVNLLSTNKKVEILKKQIKIFRVKNIIIHDRQKYLEHKDFFKKKK